MDRKLARIETITSVTPVVDADQIELAVIKGWNIVVKKGIHKAGDKVIYCEIDACLPLDDERFTFLEPRGSLQIHGKSYHQLRTAKLRKVVSQGLVLPLYEFPEISSSVDVGSDVTDKLGIILKPVTEAAHTVGDFPNYMAVKTDAERVQNLTDEFLASLNPQDWVALEKLDGTSRTVWRENGELCFASRNLHIKPDGALPDSIVDFIDKHLLEGEVLQGELIGGTIQGNPLLLPAPQFFVFKYYDAPLLPVPYSKWPEWLLKNLSIPVLSLPFPTSISSAVNTADGLKSAIAPARLAEGVVWTNTTGKTYTVLGDRSIFKVISNKYLLKHSGR